MSNEFVGIAPDGIRKAVDAVLDTVEARGRGIVSYLVVVNTEERVHGVSERALVADDEMEADHIRDNVALASSFLASVLSSPEAKAGWADIHDQLLSLRDFISDVLDEIDETIDGPG